MTQLQTASLQCDMRIEVFLGDLRRDYIWTGERDRLAQFHKSLLFINRFNTRPSYILPCWQLRPYSRLLSCSRTFCAVRSITGHLTTSKCAFLPMPHTGSSNFVRIVYVELSYYRTISYKMLPLACSCFCGEPELGIFMECKTCHAYKILSGICRGFLTICIRLSVP